MIGLYLIMVVIVLLLGKEGELINSINELINKDFSGSLLFVLGLLISIFLTAIFGD